MASELFRLRWEVDYKEHAEISRIFQVTAGAAKNLKPLFLRIVPLISAEIMKHFKSQAGPAGRWKALSPDYLKWKSRFAAGEPILQLRHKLINAATQKEAFGAVRTVKKDSLEYGVDLSKIPYARIHDIGGVAGRGSKIPKREFLFLGIKSQSEMARYVAREIWDKNLAGRARMPALRMPSWLKGIIP